MDQLQSHLVDILGEAVKKVYIKPPASMQMEYPCVLISRATGNTAFADNNPYRHQKRYLLTAIGSDPDSGLYDLLAALPRCVHDRSFPADNLNHDVFTIFFEEEE